MKTSYKYVDKEKSGVLVVSDSTQQYIPRGHRVWYEEKLDDIEVAGEILSHDYVEPVSVEVAFKDKYEEINQWRDKEETKPDTTVNVKGVDWDANEVALTRIERTLLSTFLPPFWTDAGNIDRHKLEENSFSREDLAAIQHEIVARGFKIHERQRQLKLELESLRDMEGVTSEDIQSFAVGWSNTIDDNNPTELPK